MLLFLQFFWVCSYTTRTPQSRKRERDRSVLLWWHPSMVLLPQFAYTESQTNTGSSYKSWPTFKNYRRLIDWFFDWLINTSRKTWCQQVEICQEFWKVTSLISPFLFLLFALFSKQSSSATSAGYRSSYAGLRKACCHRQGGRSTVRQNSLMDAVRFLFL